VRGGAAGVFSGVAVSGGGLFLLLPGLGCDGDQRRRDGMGERCARPPRHVSFLAPVVLRSAAETPSPRPSPGGRGGKAAAAWGLWPLLAVLGCGVASQGAVAIGHWPGGAGSWL